MVEIFFLNKNNDKIHFWKKWSKIGKYYIKKLLKDSSSVYNIGKENERN